MTQARFEVLEQLDQLEEIVLEGTRVPFSGGRLVNEQDAVELLDAVRQALPKEVERAVELLRQREAFLDQARKQAEEIVNHARRERESLINSSSIRQEAERQGSELREQARQQGEQLLLQARRQAASAEQEHQTSMAPVEGGAASCSISRPYILRATLTRRAQHSHRVE